MLIVGLVHLVMQGWVVFVIVANEPASLSRSHPAARSASVVTVLQVAFVAAGPAFSVVRYGLSSCLRISLFLCALYVCGGVPCALRRFHSDRESWSVNGSGDVVYGREGPLAVGKFLLRELLLLRGGRRARVCFACVCELGSLLLRFRDRQR